MTEISEDLLQIEARLQELADAYYEAATKHKGVIIQQYQDLLAAWLTLGGGPLYDGATLHDPFMLPEYLSALNDPCGPPIPISFLRDTLTRKDALLMTVRDLKDQQYVGKIEKIYSSRFAGPDRYNEAEVHFVGSSGAWGNTTLNDGERAIVFVSYFWESRKCYQEYGRGHLTLADQAGQAVAIAHWDLFALKNKTILQPDYLRRSMFLPNPSAPHHVAMPFVLLERYLLDELASLK